MNIGVFHPVLLHFPIVLLFTALAFDILKKSTTAHWIVIVAAAIAIPTVITGLEASETYHPGLAFIEIHERWALITLSYTILHALFRAYILLKKRVFSLYLFIALSLVNVALVSVTAEYGGMVTRGVGIWI